MTKNTQYAGIDYGMGLTNIDIETGIRYGVINQSEVLQAWADSSESVYIPYCPYCGNKLTDKFYDKITCECMSKKCPHCKKLLSESDFWDSEPQGFTYDDDGYKCQQSADDTDIFVTKSPYYTYAQYCSPCAPGAGSLMNWFKLDNGYSVETLGIKQFKNMAEAAGFPKVYCFSHDWFDDGKAPYPVFSVETGELVKAN